MSLRCIGVMMLKQLGAKSVANVRMLSTSQKLKKIGEHVPNNYLDKSIINRYKNLKYDSNKVQATYLWIDGAGENIRLKDRVVNGVPKSATDLPKWSYDGSSTYQALGGNSDIILHPRAMYRDPFKAGKHDVIVMCDTYKPDGGPSDTNHRYALQSTVDKTTQHEPWFGIEQEYTLLDTDGRPFGWPANSFPER
ncbi:Glutamine synthetase 1, mitochondrial [Pseudolycoriella hygida]|uniref:glutamine synthetase n=1 Tax=Pseudolycoriella hygida TaxID=35572 RepID=A0A9Q0NE81_9DIPT|nr:Glutamine synthetase 1, mitochondrial [Pseudolycoriella hygida]